jgi:adenine phosphoribosyltransferase
MTIKSKIRTIPNYPKKGIMFRDITTLIKDPVGFRLVIDSLTQRYINGDYDFNVIVGIESRGFIIGGALSYTLGRGFVPVRKKGKLPGEVESQEYELEYGTDRIEIHKDAIKKGDRVLLIDDLLATGGTAMAATRSSRSRSSKGSDDAGCTARPCERFAGLFCRRDDLNAPNRRCRGRRSGRASGPTARCPGPSFLPSRTVPPAP